MSLAFHDVRDITELLAAPLSPEDQCVQSMPDASPTKWHRGHTSWFFETFVLAPYLPRHQPYDPAFAFLFNSYYETVGPRHPRSSRGLITRPGAHEVTKYRMRVDEEISYLLDRGLPAQACALLELGCHHEQQHQELLVMDIKHVLSQNPTRPGYGPLPWVGAARRGANGWIDVDGGIVPIGHSGRSFAFDNEGPRHPALLAPHRIATSLVTCGQWLEFIDADGYRRPELWMSDGWAVVREQQWHAPLYWTDKDGRWQVYTLAGDIDVDLAAPVDHVSWYEADAYARWRGARLPTEQEWESTAPEPDAADGQGWYGSVWQWTASAYTAYPGYRPPAGAVGEYNGKFMVNQQVLRGSSWATPPGHARRTYRNFFPPHSRWAVTGLRLAQDL